MMRVGTAGEPAAAPVTSTMPITQASEPSGAIRTSGFGRLAVVTPFCDFFHRLLNALGPSALPVRSRTTVGGSARTASTIASGDAVAAASSATIAFSVAPSGARGATAGGGSTGTGTVPASAAASCFFGTGRPITTSATVHSSSVSVMITATEYDFPSSTTTSDAH